MDEMKQIVARNLRRLRHERKLSQEELSFQAKADRSYISQLETGVYSASVTMLAKLANALGVEVSELLKR